jgi:hypothetical protein
MSIWARPISASRFVAPLALSVSVNSPVTAAAGPQIR